MKRFSIFMMATAMLASATSSMAEDLPAFPGAEGFGRYVTGGRGGAVYHVTTLEDNNEEGSFRWAVNQSGARTIVFDVSGTIMLKSELKMRNGDVTIAGQTAPGDGICIGNYPFVISCKNVIIRFMRFRLGNEALKENKNAHEGDGLGGMDGEKWIVDHCSVSWSIDECLSVYGSKNITVQWCIASHSLVNSGHSKGAHGYGGNWGGSGASYHHNLMTNHGSRTPRLGPRPGTQKDERMDLRNNVIHNYGGNAIYGGEGMNVNIVQNYFKPGAATSKPGRIAKIDARTFDYCVTKADIPLNLKLAVGNARVGSVAASNITYQFDSYGAPSIKVYIPDTKESVICPVDMEAATFDFEGKAVKIPTNSWWPMVHKFGTYFVEGNYNPNVAAVNEDNWAHGIYDQFGSTDCDKVYPGKDNEVKNGLKRNLPVEFVYTTTHTPEEAYDVVLDYVGASLSRDEYDRMLIDEVREGKTLFTKNGLIDSQDQIVYADGSTGYPKLESKEALLDTDGDGMPDEWEKTNGLNPDNPEDGSEFAANGYTNLENYLNSLVAHIMEGGNEGGVMLTGYGTLDDPDAGIDSVVADQYAPADGRTYNLLGIEVRGELAPGIYIRNGKKFVVK